MRSKPGQPDCVTFHFRQTATLYKWRMVQLHAKTTNVFCNGCEFRPHGRTFIKDQVIAKYLPYMSTEHGCAEDTTCMDIKTLSAQASGVEIRS